MKTRTPQLLLRLDAATPATDAPWCAGGRIAYLGDTLVLMLDTTCRLPEHIGNALHLPLPPAATARQIRDAAESWLRDEAQHRFAGIVAKKSALAGCTAPHGVRHWRIALSFGRRSHWVKSEGDTLRCHWRLIEQAPAVIEQVLGNAMTAQTTAPLCDDLFALV